MKKSFLCLFLIFYPTAAVAGIIITCERVGNTAEGIIQVSYVASDDANLPRAFGLDIIVDDGNITEIVPGTESEDYWVYPGTITITSGVITDLGTPMAPSSDTGACGGSGDSCMTVEMGSLYDDPCDPEHNTPPALSGILFRFTIDNWYGFSDCNVIISSNSARGGVVLENGEQASTNLPTTCIWQPPLCYDGMADYDQWTLVGKPTCWCYPRQCYGDTDGLPEGKGSY
jgi:hypothetical protein